MVNTDDVVAKSSNSDKSFFTSSTREAEYTTVNTVDVAVKSLSHFHISNKGSKIYYRKR